MSLGEYFIDDSKLYEWLPYGGLVDMKVMRNKDDSLLSVFQYEKHIDFDVSALKDYSFSDGWVLWVERDNFGDGFKDYLFAFWNPKSHSDPDSNLSYFQTEIKSLYEAVSFFADVRLLSGRDFLDVLANTLYMEKTIQLLPDPALYLDVYLTDNLNFEVRSNDLVVNNKYMLIYSLPWFEAHSDEFISLFFESLSFVPFRFSVRHILVSDKTAKSELDKYMTSWCNKRNVIKNFLKEGILNSVNSFSNSYIIFFDENEETLMERKALIEQLFSELQVVFLIENRNFKESWWGTVPGIYKANLKPPVHGVGWEGLLMPAPSLADTIEIPDDESSDSIVDNVKNEENLMSEPFDVSDSETLSENVDSNLEH